MADSLSWNPELTVGNLVIDRQHKELLERAERLQNAIDMDQGPALVNDLLEYLSEYVVFHFDEEEKWMKEQQYPDIELHKEAHRKFLKTVLLIRSGEYVSGDLSEGITRYRMAIELLRLVANWETYHVETLDRLVARHAKTIAKVTIED